MAYDSSKLFVAGAIDYSEWDCADLVWVYFSGKPDEIIPKFFEGSEIQCEDIILVGPKGSDEKVDLEKAVLFEAEYQSGRYHDRVVRGPITTHLYIFRWIEELDNYVPHSESHNYSKEVNGRFHSREIGTHKQELRYLKI